MVMAVAAIGLTACSGNKANNESNATEQVSNLAEEALNNLKKQVEAGDAGALQAALEKVQQVIADLDPAVAAEYVQKVQDYLKANTEKIKEVAGDNVIVSTLVSTIVEAPAESVVSAAKEKIAAIGTAAKDAAEGVQEATEQAVEDAKQAAEDKVEEAKQAASDKVDEAKQAAKDKIDEGAQKAADQAKKALGL